MLDQRQDRLRPKASYKEAEFDEEFRCDREPNGMR